LKGGIEMTRLDTMARFAEPEEEKVLSECVYCDSDLYEGDTVFKYDAEHYCSIECVAYDLTEIETLGDE
jgi:zinc-finger of the FCS-type, C2-C2